MKRHFRLTNAILSLNLIFAFVRHFLKLMFTLVRHSLNSHFHVCTPFSKNSFSHLYAILYTLIRICTLKLSYHICTPFLYTFVITIVHYFSTCSFSHLYAISLNSRFHNYTLFSYTLVHSKFSKHSFYSSLLNTRFVNFLDTRFLIFQTLIVSIL